MARTLWTSEVFVGWSVFLSTLIRYKRDLARITRGKNSFVLQYRYEYIVL